MQKVFNGQSVRSVAEELGVNESLIHKRKRAAKTLGDGVFSGRELSEIEVLKKRNREWKYSYMPIKFFFAFCILLLFGLTIVHAQISNEKRISFTVPAAPWILKLPEDGLIVEEPQFKPDGRSGYFSMNDEKNKITISFYIEPAVNCKDSKSCRNMIWKIGNPAWENPQNVVHSEIEGTSYLEFLMPTFQGATVKQQNMYVEFVKDGFWIDLHISKLLYTPQEHELFERLVKSIKFEPKKTQAPK